MQNEQRAAVTAVTKNRVTYARNYITFNKPLITMTGRPIENYRKRQS